MVEADKRVAHDEPALGEVATSHGERHGWLEASGVVVGEVADDRQAKLVRFIEGDETRAGSHPGAPPEPTAFDRLEEEAGAASITEAQVGAERGEEVGVDRRHVW